ncbi:MAG: acetyl-CoA carboxylase carboxyltransferase subunit alpha [Chitinophagales bacterium]|nr:acetyl-CoA carboxylase carboxyltransferase subunit alpha [Chitinophagales bacterium]
MQLSRHTDRPYTLFYIHHIFDNFIELHGDRKAADDKAIVGGLAEIDGQGVVVIGHQKGVNTKMRQYRNFGMANPQGYRKAMRLMKLAEKFNKPIITFIDTPGAYPGIEAEEMGQAEAIARNLYDMTLLKVPIISVIIGEGASGGAIGIGVCDKLLMLENTWFTVISPESCSSILWRSWDFKEQAAEQLKLTANDMYKMKIVDAIVKEPLGGAHNNPDEMAKTLKRSLKRNLSILAEIPSNELVQKRIEKYANIGTFEERKTMQ